MPAAGCIIDVRVMDMNLPEQPILDPIRRLVDDEHRLVNQAALAAADHQRLTRVQVELDPCWDLLRQRRPLREMGGDPEAAQIRPSEIVEKYIG